MKLGWTLVMPFSILCYSISLFIFVQQKLCAFLKGGVSENKSIYLLNHTRPSIKNVSIFKDTFVMELS